MLVIGDVHGKQREYIDRVKDYDKSLCVGDVGFTYRLDELDPNNHRIVGGNHDNYDNLSPHFLGDYGIWQDIFYVRGAWSIDRWLRTSYVDWFPQEQIEYSQFMRAFELYNKVRPEIVVTHEAPESIKIMLCGEADDFTSLSLQTLLDLHKPKLWIFGHHHKSVTIEQDGTKFICLDELETYELS